MRRTVVKNRFASATRLVPDQPFHGPQFFEREPARPARAVPVKHDEELLTTGFIFNNLSAHADGERRGARSDREGGTGKVSVENAPLGTLQIDAGPRRSPSACSEILTN